MGVLMITGKQIKMIYSLATSIGINNNTHDDELHILIYSRTEKESVKDLTKSEASGIISELKQLKGSVKSIKYVDVPPGRMSKEQQDKAWRLIYMLCEIDKSEAPAGERMKGAVKKILDMDINMKNKAPFRMVTVRQGSILIDNLKRYVSSAERKKAGK